MATEPGKRTVTYGRFNSLQTISVATLPPRLDGYWVVYIHGGAWRDPTITADTFERTENILRDSPSLPIAGFASISYRLSAHPNHPQDETTPREHYRDAKHPDHIRDVEAALAFLQNTYSFGAKYILVGHSCGATMAFQAVMGAVAGHREVLFNGTNDNDARTETISTSPGPLPPRLTSQPTAIVGVAGIYDLRRLRDDHSDISAYREFIEGAFGADELLWDAVSPAQMFGSRGVEGGWKNGRLVILAHSKDDELVDAGQLEAMKDALKGWEQDQAQVPVHELTDSSRRVRAMSIEGAHDEAWLTGEELARTIKYAFVELLRMGLAPEPEPFGGQSS
ncbi:hypothetical protein N7532_005973 [Penicillium argentinense]|uniref:Kynurenine formamidase n=1 Tax=Penicillium argentinense TaxID=1131581 RepID=A0A9W9KBH9_9EURO|nr:uncharacterized protein N7532_005973 [Penicillium argentinense]KAJ5098972.1 hypothetical protein N7532_005973 [Penicillium argentinense]